jgi:hypothetical protein
LACDVRVQRAAKRTDRTLLKSLSQRRAHNQVSAPG